MSLVFWMLFGFIILYEGGYFYHRLSSPWRRLHFPLMVRYSAIAGVQMGAAESTGKEFNFEKALHAFVKNIYPYREDLAELTKNLEDLELTDRFKSPIKSADEKMANFSDRKALEELFKKSNSTIDQNKLQELMDKIETALRNPEEKGLRLKYVIGEIVSRDYGEQERLKYIHAVITGKAN